MKRIIAVLMAAALMLAVCGNCFATPLYENAEIVDHPKYGQISVCTAPEADCTLEALNDWYYNYITVTDYAWYMILYSDSPDNKGVYGSKDGVEMTVTFAKDSKGWYVGSEKFAVWYLPSGEDGLVFSMEH